MEQPLHNSMEKVGVLYIASSLLSVLQRSFPLGNNQPNTLVPTVSRPLSFHFKDCSSAKGMNRGLQQLSEPFEELQLPESFGGRHDSSKCIALSMYGVDVAQLFLNAHLYILLIAFLPCHSLPKVAHNLVEKILKRKILPYEDYMQIHVLFFGDMFPLFLTVPLSVHPWQRPYSDSLSPQVSATCTFPRASSHAATTSTATR